MQRRQFLGAAAACAALPVGKPAGATDDATTQPEPNSGEEFTAYVEDPPTAEVDISLIDGPLYIQDYGTGSWGEEEMDAELIAWTGNSDVTFGFSAGESYQPHLCSLFKVDPDTAEFIGEMLIDFAGRVRSDEGEYGQFNTSTSPADSEL